MSIGIGKLLTLRECSERSGLRESTWRAWILHRKVPFYKVGRSVRIAEADLDRLIERAKVPAESAQRTK
jgi:excisionase family DNA binding protein